MARRRRSTLAVTAEEAQQALSFLVHEGKVAASEVQKALSHRERLIREIRERMAALGVESLEAGKTVRKRAVKAFRAAKKTSRPARKRATHRITAATRKLYRLQGKYMSALRPLSKEARAGIKAIRKKSGIDAAIKAAKRLAR
jgi:aminopeptidase N